MRALLVTATRTLLVVLGCLAATALTSRAPASAHPMPYTGILLDVHRTAVEAELQMPVEDLALATGIDVRTLTSSDALGQHAGELRDYLRQHMRLMTPDGIPWSVEIGEMMISAAVQRASGPYREVVVHTVFTPPPNADVRRFTVGYDVIVHRVATHEAVVSVRRDWAAGRVDSYDGPQTIGVIRTDVQTMTVPPLTVDLSQSGYWKGFLAMIKLGAHHILTGTDHLLFLLTLLLAAPLVAKGGRWRGYIGFRPALKRITAITVAFTVGHSVALTVSAVSRAELPRQAVEVLIAASILISGVHAVRPLFPGREAAVASCFGLVHGMALSFTLAAMGLSAGDLATSLLGFNLGIEAIQLALVVVALPPLLLLATTRTQPVIRVTAATLAVAAAAGWLLDRVGLPNPLSRMADHIGSITTPVAAALVALSAIAATRLLIRPYRPALQSNPPVGGGIADALPQPADGRMWRASDHAR